MSALCLDRVVQVPSCNTDTVFLQHGHSVAATWTSACSAETRGQFEQQLRAIVRGNKTLASVLTEDGERYKGAFEAATAQSQVRLSLSLSVCLWDRSPSRCGRNV